MHTGTAVTGTRVQYRDLYTGDFHSQTHLGARRALTPLAVTLSLKLSPLVRVLVRMLERREGLRRAHVRCLVRVKLEREP